MTVKFSVPVYLDSTHTIEVSIHPSVRALRSMLRKRGDKDYRDTLACCWQPDEFEQPIELHFCREHLSVEIISHESVHAAWHRSLLLGYPRDHEELQEMLAENTGVIVARVVDKLRELRIKIK